MKTPIEDHELTRWLDEELPPADRARFEARLESDISLKAEVDAFQKLRADLRACLPSDMPVPHADFFNSQIQVRIAQMETEETGSRAPHGAAAGWFSWLRLPTFATAAAAVIAVTAAAVWIWNAESPKGDREDLAQITTSVENTYTPNPAVQIHSFHSNAADATVLMLDGLDEIPANMLLAGIPR